jgi:proteasome accessory factor A
MERRIFGLENEYGVTCTFRGQRRLSPDEVARYLFRRVVHWGRSSNVFLENGARLYLDVGSHPEYATPECDSVGDLVAHDKAGERILEALLSAAELRLHEEGISGQVYLFKNNTDSAGNSYGCHENYLVARQGEFARMADVLIPFFVTRQIYCGAGKVLHGPRGAQFCIINTRDEPHADAERFRRLHVIVGDSNMNEWTTFLKVGVTDLVLRMVEANTVMRDLTLENPIRAIREISHDVTCKKRVRLANGRELSAIEIQTEYLERTQRFMERRGIDTQSRKLLDEWQNAIEALAEGEPQRLVRKVDWVAKQHMVERYRRKHGLPLSSPRVALLDLAYHDVNRNRGLYYVIERSGQADRIATDAEIQTAVREPPQTTRAKLRGDFIRNAKQKRRDYTVDWVHLKLNDQAQRTVLCKDPFRSEDDRVEQLIAHM